MNLSLLNLIGMILTFIVALEHIGICGIEMFASPEKQADAFDMETAFTRQGAARIAMANQGIYNGMLGVILIIAFFIFPQIILIKVWSLILGMIVIVAIYGGFTATRKIFFIQMLPALIALILLWL